MRVQAADLRLPSGKYYGQTLKQYRTGGFSLSETRYLRGSALPRHSHESHYFCFVLRGSYKESYDRKVRFCEPLMTLYHPAGELHSQSFELTAVDLFRIEFNSTRLQSTSRPALLMDGCDFRGGLPAGLASKLYREFQEPDEVSHLAIEGLGLELIALMARKRLSADVSRQPPGWLVAANELIKSRYLDHLTLNEVAGAVGVHAVTLAREFRRHYQCTVGDIVRRERINFACRELLKPPGSISSVALAAGFYDQSHFAKIFKRLIGMTPGHYRDKFSS